RNDLSEEIARPSKFHRQGASQPSWPDNRNARLQRHGGRIAGHFFGPQNGTAKRLPDSSNPLDANFPGRLLYIVAMAKSSRSKTRSRKARVLSSREVYHGPAFTVTAD